jgi:hypothetical protein
VSRGSNLYLCHSSGSNPSFCHNNDRQRLSSQRSALCFLTYYARSIAEFYQNKKRANYTDRCKGDKSALDSCWIIVHSGKNQMNTFVAFTHNDWFAWGTLLKQDWPKAQGLRLLALRSTWAKLNRKFSPLCEIIASPVHLDHLSPSLP